MSIKRLSTVLCVLLMVLIFCTPVYASTNYNSKSETYTFWKYHPDYGWKTFSYKALSKTGWYDASNYRVADYGHVLLYIKDAWTYPRWEICDNAALFAYRLYEGSSSVCSISEASFTGPGESYIISTNHLITMNTSTSLNYALTISSGPKCETVTYWECDGWLNEFNDFEYNLGN